MSLARPISDYEKWMRGTSEDTIAFLIDDNGVIVDRVEGLPGSSPLEYAALYLEQVFAMWHFDKRGGSQPWFSCVPCEGEAAGNATLVVLHARDFRETMRGDEALTRAFRTLGRVEFEFGPAELLA